VLRQSHELPLNAWTQLDEQIDHIKDIPLFDAGG
jgi:hypothetical protein